MKLTKKKFLDAAKAGWEKYGYTSGQYYRDEAGWTTTRDSGRISSCCAIGGAADILGMAPGELCEHLLDCGVSPGLIISTSDKAGSAKVALEKIEQLF